MMKKVILRNDASIISLLTLIFLSIFFNACKPSEHYSCGSEFPQLNSVSTETTSLEIRNLNHSSCFPEEISNFHNLKKLHFIGNDCDMNSSTCKNIDSIPSSIICSLSELEELVLVMNGLDDIPECISKMSNLKRLDLSDNPGISLQNVVTINSLEELSLNGSALEKLPAEISNLKNLRSLGLANNNFSEEEKERIESILPNVRIYW